ncbi:MAG TPA: ZIP family metal transporter [Chthoniobacterales bacterium]
MDATTHTSFRLSKSLAVLSAITPLVLLAGLIWWFFHGGSQLIERPVPPIEQISIRRVELKPGEFKLTIRNTGPMPVEMTLVTVDEAIWKAEFSPSPHLERLQEATVRIPFDWVSGDPYKIELFTASGLSFEKEIPVAVETPTPSARMFLVFSAMGFYVGILPVAFGILWLPFLRQLGKRWINFFLSFTIGLLVFLGVDALHEGFEVAGALPGVFSGVGLLAIGFLLAFLFITGIDQFLRSRPDAEGRDASLILAYMIAFGIGIHNLGEGLAIGSAYASGEIALGALLLLGFTIHNTTEGLAIVSPLARSRVRLFHLALLGIVGGAPAILGCWMGGFSYSDIASAFFLAIGAGAVFQVVWSIGVQMMKTAEGNLFHLSNAAGLMLGMVVMWATALLVSA